MPTIPVYAFWPYHMYWYYNYRIARNFRGRKFTRIGRKWAFRGENFHGVLNRSYRGVRHAQHFVEKTFVGDSQFSAIWYILHGNYVASLPSNCATMSIPQIHYSILTQGVVALTLNFCSSLFKCIAFTGFPPWIQGDIKLWNNTNHNNQQWKAHAQQGLCPEFQPVPTQQTHLCVTVHFAWTYYGGARPWHQANSRAATCQGR